MKYELVKLKEGDVARLRVRSKKYVPYDELVKLLVEGHEVFIPDMNRKTASYVRRALSRYIGCEVEAYPSEFQDRMGYAFKISLVDSYIKGLSKQ